MLVTKLYTPNDEYGEFRTLTTGVDQGILINFQVHGKGDVDCEIISSNVADTYEELAEVLRGLADTLDKGELID